MKKSVKGFQGGDEYVAILYEVEPKDPVIRRYPRIPNNQWPQNPYPQHIIAALYLAIFLITLGLSSTFSKKKKKKGKY
jgi:hypothetical protein